ncbi:MAG: GntR family transcriptional regulator, partial [Betaproteobacteria bacterium]
MGTRRSPGDAHAAGSPAAIARPPARAGRAKSIRLNENEIYRRIYDAVLDHRLQPGTKLKEVALDEAFGANRGVV